MEVDDDDDDDDEMGEMVSPAGGPTPLMDSDEEDEAFMNESLGYPNLFSVGKYKGYRGGGGSSSYDDVDDDNDAQEQQNDSSDGEDDGLVEILVPGRKSSTG